MMTLSQQIIIILMCVCGTMATRFLPFIIFSDKRPTPKYVCYLGKVLPAAIFGMLIIYCVKNVNLFSQSHGIPEATGIAVTALVHILKRKMLLSIAAGTICYMFLVQYVF